MIDLKTCTIEELHKAILSPHAPEMHGELERACMARIAAIPRLPLTGVRWWHYANAQAYPFGN